MKIKLFSLQKNKDSSNEDLRIKKDWDHISRGGTPQSSHFFENLTRSSNLSISWDWDWCSLIFSKISPNSWKSNKSSKISSILWKSDKILQNLKLLKIQQIFENFLNLLKIWQNPSKFFEKLTKSFNSQYFDATPLWTRNFFKTENGRKT